MTAGSILIVDDDVRSAGKMVELMAHAGFEPVYALTEASALTRLSECSFDVVILDVLKTDALKLLRWLHMQGHTPVLMLTSREREEDWILGLELGADDDLSKPFRTREPVARLGRSFAAPAGKVGRSRIRSRWAP